MAINTTLTKGAFPDTQYFPATEVVPDALILTHTTIGAQIEGDKPTMRVPYVEADPEADINAEGTEITEKDPQISELTVNTHKVAVLTVVSNEAYQTEGVAGLLTGSLSKAVTLKADRLLLQNPLGDDQPTGLANIEGIEDGGTIGENLSPLITAIGTIGTNGGTPTTIVMGYDAWAYLLNLTDTNGHGLINPDVANSPTPVLYGLPVILTAQAPANTVLILDQSQIISAISPVTTATTSERYFEKDSVGIRVTFRLGFGLLHPNRIAKLTITTQPAA